MQEGCSGCYVCWVRELCVREIQRERACSAVGGLSGCVVYRERELCVRERERERERGLGLYSILYIAAGGSSWVCCVLSARAA